MAAQSALSSYQFYALEVFFMGLTYEKQRTQWLHKVHQGFQFTTLR